MRVQRMMLQILIIRKVLELKGEELVTHFGDEFIHSSGEESPILLIIKLVTGYRDQFYEEILYFKQVMDLISVDNQSQQLKQDFLLVKIGLAAHSFV